MELKEQIENFLIENYPHCRNWMNLKSYLQWFYDRDCYGVICNEKKEITGVGLARPVEKPEDGLVHYHFDPLGSCLFVDLYISKNDNAKKRLFEVIYAKAGKPTLIAFKRGTNKVKKYYFERFMKLYNKENIGNSDIK